jgi:hypothetical protein
VLGPAPHRLVTSAWLRGAPAPMLRETAAARHPSSSAAIPRSATLMHTKLCALVVSIIAAAGCLRNEAVGPGPGAAARVLFIGNSYTYSADVPGIVQALGDAVGDSIYVETVAGPNMALIDHWHDGAALAAVRRGGWDFVVLQQGPSSVEVNRDTLRLGTQLFATEIAKIGGRPALFSAWPQQSRPQDFTRAIESYRLAAADVNGVFLPVASAWLAAWQRLPSVELYSDGLHPSVEGAYLAALVIYSSLRGTSPRLLPLGAELRTGATVELVPETASVLKSAAAEVLGYP